MRWIRLCAGNNGAMDTLSVYFVFVKFQPGDYQLIERILLMNEMNGPDPCMLVAGE